MQNHQNWIIDPTDPVLVTGANGFIGARVAATLLQRGFQKVRCLVRSVNDATALRAAAAGAPVPPELLEGNLLSPDSCATAVKGVKLIIHLAAGGDKSFSGSFLNMAVTTRNLIQAALDGASLKRFLNVSSFAVYSNANLPHSQVLDESCPAENDPVARFDAYCYGKLRQDEVVFQYGRERGLPYVIVRPGAVYGPKARAPLHGRIGIDTFGFFIHLGGGNRLPFTYVDNCADAIVLAALVKGIDGEIFNIVDDDLPTSRQFLRQFKRDARSFHSLYVPYPIFYAFSYFWERYAVWSREQLPAVFNRRRCVTYWRGNQYSNAKAKRLLGWTPQVSSAEGARRHCEYFKNLFHQKKP